MTKKDFVAFAKEIKAVVDLSNSHGGTNTTTGYGLWVKAKTQCELVVRVAKQSNPAFNEANFRKACGLD